MSFRPGRALPDIAIGHRRVGPGHPPYVIAEAGINHNGNVATALEMVHVAKAAGADAVKFQTFRADELIGDPTLVETYRSQGREVTEPAIEMFRRCELPRDAWGLIRTECDRVGVTFLSTPQNRGDLDLLLDVGIPAVKVGSDDFTNLPLIAAYAATGLPLLLSCGMADFDDVQRTLDVAGALHGHPTALLLCTSQYPTPAKDAHVSRLGTLSAAFPDVVLGYSDHTQGPLASCLAVAFGATLFEKHFTLDHGLGGPDHWFSADPEELSEWVRAIRTAAAIVGRSTVRPTDAELLVRDVTRRGVVALRRIETGERFTMANVGIRRPATGLPPECLEGVLRCVAARTIEAGEGVGVGDASHGEGRP